MIKSTKSGRLYNIMFLPFWVAYLMPVLSLLMLPVNFLVDSLVLLGTAWLLKMENKRQLWSKCILKVWLLGFAADFIGSSLIFLVYWTSEKWFADTWFYSSIAQPLIQKDLSCTPALLIILASIAVCGVLIYVFNRKITFRHLDLPDSQLRILSLTLAIFTAPYTILSM